MKPLVIGLGIQGHKRAAVAGADLVATVDTVNTQAKYRRVQDVPMEAYDSALVCTPDTAKFEILEYLLSHGKHVLVEKPLFLKTAEEFQRIADLTERNRLVCYTAYNHRFEPHIVSLKELIQSDQLGQIYLASFFYGNGTARDVRDSVWKDGGSGVLPDLGSHLLDMARFLFGDSVMNRAMTAWSLDRFENRSYDHVLFGSSGKDKGLALKFQATLLSWRNTFRADVYGEKGSAHIDCLCKWGPSVLTTRKRVLPSGRPDQQVQTLECADPTWKIEYDHFVSLCRKREAFTNLQTDRWMCSALSNLVEDDNRSPA